VNPTKPLTPEEVAEAAEKFFPLFDIVHRQMPENSNVEDTLKVMESVCSLAHKLRMESDNDSAGPFGFNKKTKEETSDEDSVPNEET
jgi:hypothetical protein